MQVLLDSENTEVLVDIFVKTNKISVGVAHFASQNIEREQQSGYDAFNKNRLRNYYEEVERWIKRNTL